jgi:hypothetical protein
MSSNVRTAGAPAALGSARVLDRHEAERAGRERCLEGVAAGPVNRGAGQLGSLPRPAYGDIGDVDRGDRPAALSEPDRVGALTRTDVEGPARGEAGDLGDKPPVWAPAPHRPVALAVPRVPLGGLRHRAEPLLAVFVHARHYGARWATGVPYRRNGHAEAPICVRRAASTTMFCAPRSVRCRTSWHIGGRAEPLARPPVAPEASTEARAASMES